MVTGKLVADPSGEGGRNVALTRLVARGGEPLLRRGVDMAMRMMGEQFVTGQTINEALRNAKWLEAKSHRYSYDMLGEAATTADDAKRFKRYLIVAVATPSGWPRLGAAFTTGPAAPSSCRRCTRTTPACSAPA